MTLGSQFSNWLGVPGSTTKSTERRAVPLDVGTRSLVVQFIASSVLKLGSQS